jgi:hypothetical protein
MGLGYYGYAKRTDDVPGRIAYRYSGVNLNVEYEKDSDHQLDGLFTLAADVLDMYGGIIQEANGQYFAAKLAWTAIEQGRITVERECANAFRRDTVPCDYLAFRLIVHVLDERHKNGEWPDRTRFIQ